MQRPLCLKCARVKTDPLERCPNCGMLPEGYKNQAQHLLVAEYDFSLEQFQNVQEHIRSGGSLEFDPDALMTTEAALKAHKPDAHWFLFYGLFIALPLLGLMLWFFLSVFSE